MNKNEVYAYYRETLDGIKASGVEKNERIIVTPQSAHIHADGKDLINMCANNYLGLADNEENGSSIPITGKSNNSAHKSSCYRLIYASRSGPTDT